MALNVSGITHYYNGHQVLSNVSLTVTKGSFCCITGPSGCGKTTLLRIIAGILQPQAGVVTMDGVPLNRRSGDIGFVFQEGSLFPWRTVEENVGFGLEVLRIGKAARRDTVNYYLHLVGLTDFARHYPHQLSGGMKKRVALARTLAYKPRLLLMDEPFAFMDELKQRKFQRELLRIWENETVTVVYVTHSAEEAVSLSDKIVVLSGCPARIIESLANPLSRPRDSNDPVFIKQKKRLWELLENSAIEI